MRPFFLRGPLRNADPAPPGGGGGTPPPSPAPAPAQQQQQPDLGKLLADFKASLLAELKPAAPAPEPPKPSADPKPSDHDNAALLKRIADMEKQSEADRKAAKAASDAARDKDRIAQLRTHLSSHQFATDAAAEDALGYFAGKVKLNDQDQLVTPDGTPVKDYVAKVLTEERNYLLKPRDAGGAGAHNGGGGAPGGKPIDVDDIRPGMSKEEMQRVEAELARMMRRHQ